MFEIAGDTSVCSVIQSFGENNRQFPLQTNFKTKQGDENKSPQLERAY